MSSHDTGAGAAPRTRAGRAVLLDAEIEHLALAIEEEASRAASSPAVGLDRPEIDEHEMAAAIHPILWMDDKPHIVDPDDGDDCTICYNDAAKVLARLRDGSGASETP